MTDDEIKRAGTIALDEQLNITGLAERFNVSTRQLKDKLASIGISHKSYGKKGSVWKMSKDGITPAS